MPKRLVIVKPFEIGFEDYSVPPVGDGEVLTETLYSGISAGTEMAYYRGTGPELAGSWDGVSGVYDPDQEPTFSYPLSYGYENVGRIVEVGKGVRGLAPGDVVFSYAGHATHVVQDASGIWKLPPEVSPRAGNLLAILRLCFNGLLASNLHLGETVGVFGLGGLGQLLVQLCHLSGARVIGVDLIASRRDLARQLGADETVAPSEVNLPVWVREQTEGRGLDVAFEVTANEKGLESAVRCVARQAKVISMSFYQGTASMCKSHRRCKCPWSYRTAGAPSESAAQRPPCWAVCNWNRSPATSFPSTRPPMPTARLTASRRKRCKSFSNTPPPADLGHAVLSRFGSRRTVAWRMQRVTTPSAAHARQETQHAAFCYRLL